jgi:hypothetical protein
MSLISKLKANKTFIAGAALFTSANLADLLLTNYALITFSGQEANPVLNGVLGNYGVGVFSAIKFSIGLALIPLAYHINGEGKKVAKKHEYKGLSIYAPGMGNYLLYGGAAVMTLAATNTLMQML